MTQESFGERLKRLRDRAGFTGKAFSDMIEVPYQTYMGYENKGTEPKFDVLLRIASLLHVSVEDLLGYHPHARKTAIYWIEKINSKCGFIYAKIDENNLVTVKDYDGNTLYSDDYLNFCVDMNKLEDDIFSTLRESIDKLLTVSMRDFFFTYGKPPF